MMDKQHDDGGAAFPVPLTQRADGQCMTAAEFFEGGNGMTLRDYFAAKAMQSAMACNYSIETGDDTDKTGVFPGDWLWRESEQQDVATLAYGIADAMIAARKKREYTDAP